MSITGRSGRRFEQAQRGLGDVHGLVADALEVGAHLHGRGDEAQVGRHGLLQGEHLQTAVVDLDLEAIHRGVAFDHGLREFGASLHQRDEGLAGSALRMSDPM